VKIWAQQYEEKDSVYPWFSAYLMASSLGNAMALTPAFKAKMSVSVRCLPLGRMQPKAKGISGNINRAVAVTLAISVGWGGLTSAMAVPRMGVKAITTKAEGL